jgi:hypothetical protein
MTDMLTPQMVDDRLSPDAWQRIVLALGQQYDAHEGVPPTTWERFMEECKREPEIYNVLLGVVLAVVEAYLKELESVDDLEEDEDGEEEYDDADEE